MSPRLQLIHLHLPAVTWTCCRVRGCAGFSSPPEVPKIRVDLTTEALTISTSALLATQNQPTPLHRMIPSWLGRHAEPELTQQKLSSWLFPKKNYQKYYNHFKLRDARIAFCCSNQSVLSPSLYFFGFSSQKGMYKCRCSNTQISWVILISIIAIIAWRQNCKQ